MADFADILREAAQNVGNSGDDVVNIIDFVESKTFGLGLPLYPVQRIILKAHYGLPLNGITKSVPMRNWRGDDLGNMTEADYLKWVHDEGRCNIAEVQEGNELVDLILAVGRRSGKTLLASCIMAYETYKLVKKGDPHKYYGLAESNPIQLISVATDKDQAGLLFSEVKTHFDNCEFFTPYIANSTETYAKFQTPRDQDKFGLWKDNRHARRSVKITFRPCVAKGLRGAGNLVVILDEVAHFVDNSNQASADAIIEAVEPSLAALSPKDPSDKTHSIGPSEGRMIMISSPLGKAGAFYEHFEVAMSGKEGSESMLAMQAPTWEVNPAIHAGFFRKNFAKDARKFYQEFGAVFTDKTKGWIDEPQDLLDCIDKDLRPSLQGKHRQAYFMGIDVAIKKDATAVAIGHIEDHRIVLDFIGKMQAGESDHEFDEEGNKVTKLDFGEILEWIIALTRKYRIHKGMFDQEQGYALEHLLRRAGIKNVEMTRMTEALNSDMYNKFKSLMYDRTIRLFDHPIQPGHQHAEYVEQLLELQAEYKSKFKVKVFAPKRAGAHDDMADALVRMVWLASESLSGNATIANVQRGAFASQAGGGGRVNGRNRWRQYAKMGGSHPSRMRTGGRGGGGRGRGGR